MSAELEKALDEIQLADALIELPGWELKGKQIVKTYAFKNFAQTMEFVNAVAQVAESMNHHPDIHINFTKVKLLAWTHKYNAITKLDTKLAAGADKAFDNI
ncbi:4a-hydroxytetrahydrobiopterin dehydratase [soil metagenome]